MPVQNTSGTVYKRGLKDKGPSSLGQRMLPRLKRWSSLPVPRSYMAVRRVILSTASPSQNLASSLLDFANNDSLSTGEIYRTRKQTKSTFTSLGLFWTGDFESLKHFVADSLKLTL
jgi:hypothetical protein